MYKTHYFNVALLGGGLKIRRVTKFVEYCNFLQSGTCGVYKCFAELLDSQC
jgi:hypothetical protein